MAAVVLFFDAFQHLYTGLILFDILFLDT